MNVPTQEEAIPILKWLIDDTNTYLGTGRTEALAHAHIRLALERPNIKVSVKDHFDSPICKDNLVMRILSLWQGYPEHNKFKLLYNRSYKSIMMRPI